MTTLRGGFCLWLVARNVRIWEWMIAGISDAPPSVIHYLFLPALLFLAQKGTPLVSPVFNAASKQANGFDVPEFLEGLVSLTITS